MVHSDWIKGVGDSTHEIYWYGKHNKYSYVRVWKPAISKGERDRRGINTYGVSMRVGRDSDGEKKFFKTRTQAITEAMKFMRENSDD